MSFKLNDGQYIAVHGAAKMIKSDIKQVVSISGGAGTGKTTVIYKIIEELGLYMHEVLFATFTGKAALQLTRNGCNTHTIHSTFYEVAEIPLFDKRGNYRTDHRGRILLVPTFRKRDSIPPQTKLIVFDEAGMIPDIMREDLLSFGVPILAVGDLNQLDPVIGEPAFLKSPDFLLTEIMRQKKGDPIIGLSQMAIKNMNIPFGKYGDKCFVIRKSELTDKMMRLSEMIISGKNRTRHDINKHFRENILQIKNPYPRKGEKLICRKNNRHEILKGSYQLVNGMSGYSLSNISRNHFNYFDKQVTFDFRPDFTHSYFKNISIDLEYLGDNDLNTEEKNRKYKYKQGNKFDFGYCATCHLCQGSQYKSVIVMDECLDPRSYNKWLYTAITRAKEFLILAR